MFGVVFDCGWFYFWIGVIEFSTLELFGFLGVLQVVLFLDLGNMQKTLRECLILSPKHLCLKPTELAIKWGFVDFYLLISLLMKVYIVKDKEQNFASFYIAFEGDRRSVEDAAELINAGDSWSKDLYEYIDAFNKSGGLRKNIEIRNRVYTNKLFKEISSLETQDI